MFSQLPQRRYEHSDRFPLFLISPVKSESLCYHKGLGFHEIAEPLCVQAPLFHKHIKRTNRADNSRHSAWLYSTFTLLLKTPLVPLPLIDDLFAGLSGGQKFSKIDLNQAYLQMHVDEESREWLTINTHKGLFRYCRLPFGITSAPALFQRAMDQILSGLPGVQCYLDDILCTGANDEEHLRNVDAVLKRLRQYGLRVRKEKCEFLRPSVEYLGHVIDHEGLQKAPSKTKAIVDAPAPENVSQLRSFLGLLNYYGRFIPNLASLLKPLHELLCKDVKWKWTNECNKAFRNAKNALISSEVLTHFNPSYPIQLACDASPYGVGAVISHVFPNEDERPIAFASRTLNKAESNYAQLEREALSIIFGVRKFHQYLYGRKFTLLTDHRPLATILGPHAGIPSLAAARLQRRWELSVQSGCLLWGRRVIVPQSLRAKMLAQLHAGHSGIVQMKEMARSYFWWPGLDKQIEETVKSCSSCQKIRNNPPAAPLHPWDFPQDPWHRIHIDFTGPFENRMFLVAIDAHSKWPEVAIMKSTTSEKAIEKLGEMFSRFGAPAQLVSDNGPQFVSKEMVEFLQANGVQHIKSAPYHLATNGLAERFVQTLKHALKASQGQSTLHQRLHEFLLKYRTSVHATTKVSPASLMFSREIRTGMDLLKPPTLSEIVQMDQQKQVKYRDLHSKNRVFAPGDSVMARSYQSKEKWAPATIIAQTGPVSYTVQTADGVWRRHVDQLLGTSDTTPELSIDCDDASSVIPEMSCLPDVSNPNNPAVIVSNSTNAQTEPETVSEPVSTSGKSEVTVERRYPARDRRPPDRLDL
ncbi:uncharacterized protein K02A2.6-like [Corythoichthys intestinalis]|uniref:uncharacterized protein K02A2.6-like n=1 Tax=Corythoichthys intestinalis TaxID=161448 RepID=UPI0025A5859C|nr:uncharacterized protein K02A2.6-like [Corythoichthys intestinalis]